MTVALRPNLSQAWASALMSSMYGASGLKSRCEPLHREVAQPGSPPLRELQPSVPKRSLTTLAAGHSPFASRSSASPAAPARVRARPVVGGRQPAVAVAPRAHRVEHARRVSSAAAIAPGWQALQYA